MMAAVARRSDDHGVRRFGSRGNIEVFRMLFRFMKSMTCRGFQGYWLKDTVKGPHFEETNTQIFLNQTFLEESQKWFVER